MARESLKYIQTKTGADGATRLFFRKRGEKKVEIVSGKTVDLKEIKSKFAK